MNSFIVHNIVKTEITKTKRLDTHGNSYICFDRRLIDINNNRTDITIFSDTKLSFDTGEIIDGT